MSKNRKVPRSRYCRRGRMLTNTGWIFGRKIEKHGNFVATVVFHCTELYESSVVLGLFDEKHDANVPVFVQRFGQRRRFYGTALRQRSTNTPDS